MDVPPAPSPQLEAIRTPGANALPLKDTSATYEKDQFGVDAENAAPAALAPVVSFCDDNVAKMSSWRRWVTLFVVCWMALPMTFMSTSIMTVNPEIAATFGTKTTAISTANAGAVVGMAVSPLIWLPITTIIGRRTAYLAACIVLVLCSLGCALANNMTTFVTMWVLSGTTGPFFLIAGQTILSDIFEPTVRGTAVGFFLGSSVSAQSITPMVGSIIATFTSWRVIFGVQGGMTLIGFILGFIFVPRAKDLSNLQEQDEKSKQKPTLMELVQAFNPVHVFRLWKYPGVLLCNITCGLFAINQYGILSSVRHIINPLFGLEKPLYSGLFYLAPGVGFLAGSLVGGNISDRTVIRYKKKRNGVRLAEDRLNGSHIWTLLVLPLGTLMYGWGIDQNAGGKGLPIASAFIEGFGLMASFNGLNTYAAEAHPQYKAAAISGKYVVQYSFGACSVGGIVPLIDAIGVGWTFTITAVCALLGGCAVLVITRFLVRDRPSIPRTNFTMPKRSSIPS